MDLVKAKEQLTSTLESVNETIDRLRNADPAKDNMRGSDNTIDEDTKEAEQGFRTGELLEAALIKQSRLQEALKRVDDGTYGVCERCGEKIDDARLEARPDARYCINCQRIVDNEAN